MANDPRLISIRRDSFPNGQDGDRMYYEIHNAFERLNKLLSDVALVDTPGDISTINSNISTIETDITTIEDSIEYSSYTKAIDYTVLTTDKNKLGILTGNSADKTFTLPSLGATNDGELYRFLNASEYTLTITPGDSSSVWNSGNGYGIELPNKGTMVMLRYDHARTKWDIINKTGRKVLIEGLVLAEPMDSIGLYGSGATTAGKNDLTDKHRGNPQGNTYASYDNTYFKFSPSCYVFDGTGDFIVYYDSPNWDIFGTQTGHKTVAFWVYNNAAGAEESYISHYGGGAGDRWLLYKDTSNRFGLYYINNSALQVSIFAGSISATTWYHLALVINGSDIGIYIDGQQVAYAGTWNIGTLTGSLNVGRDALGGYLAGRMQDLHISYNNPYNADPQSDNSDSFTVPVQPFQGVMQ